MKFMPGNLVKIRHEEEEGIVIHIADQSNWPYGPRVILVEWRNTFQGENEVYDGYFAPDELELIEETRFCTRCNRLGKWDMLLDSCKTCSAILCDKCALVIP